MHDENCRQCRSGRTFGHNPTPCGLLNPPLQSRLTPSSLLPGDVPVQVVSPLNFSRNSSHFLTETRYYVNVQDGCPDDSNQIVRGTTITIIITSARDLVLGDSRKLCDPSEPKTLTFSTPLLLPPQMTCMTQTPSLTGPDHYPRRRGIKQKFTDPFLDDDLQTRSLSVTPSSYFFRTRERTWYPPFSEEGGYSH